MKYTKVKPKRFDNLLVITKDEFEDLKKGLPIQRKGYNIMLEDLRKWFKQKWVNIGKKDKSGKHPECGTSGDKRGYAKCVPASKAASMSKKDKASATRRKRRAQNKAGRGGKASKGQGKKPIMTKTEARGTCWVGYKQVGMKKKGNRMVPNCVKEEVDIYYEENGKGYGYTF